MSGACRFLSLCKASEVAEGKAIKVEKEGLILMNETFYAPAVLHFNISDKET